MLNFTLTFVALTAIAVPGLAQEQVAPPKGPAPRFVTIGRVDWDKGKLVVSEQCLPHPNVVSRTITRQEANRRAEPLETGSTLKPRVLYYTTTHTLPLDRVTLYNARGKSLPENAWERLKPGAMVLMSADGHPVEPEYLDLIRPETPVLVVAVEALPSPYESPESTDAIQKQLRP